MPITIDGTGITFPDGTQQTTKAVHNSGTYAGDSTANRAIAHGLGVTPKIVFIVGLGVPTSYWYRLFSGQGAIFYQTGAAATSTPVTAPDATNFYVGNATPGYDQSANLTGNSYAWVAIG